jgi:predicted phage baseplate assembly protein
VRWHAVPDLYGSGPRDRHYTLDALTGRVRFGDGTGGMAPPSGQNNVRLTYQTGGGAAGNRPAGTLVELRSAIPSVEGVTNHEPAGGGAEAEPLERLTARGPRVLRHRDRAVAAPDLEDLAAAASSDVARAVAIVPSFNPFLLWLDPGARATPDHDAVTAGRVGIVVVPRSDPGSGVERPTPSLGLLREVREHVAQRLPATAELWVAGPEWVVATVAVTVVPDRPDRADAVADTVRSVLATFLHPLHGGPGGTGWAFAARPRRSQLIAQVEAVDGVDHVRSLQVSLRPETPDLDRAATLRGLLERPLREIAGQAPPEPVDAAWLKRALVCSGVHTVSVAFDT